VKIIARNIDSSTVNQVQGDKILMENVGYTDGDHTPVNYHIMKVMALKRCLQREPVVISGTGSSVVPDFQNPSILAWLFPHLDPWGIGGFYHPNRSIKLTMQEQLAHLLSIDDLWWSW